MATTANRIPRWTGTVQERLVLLIAAMLLASNAGLAAADSFSIVSVEFTDGENGPPACLPASGEITAEVAVKNNEAGFHYIDQLSIVLWVPELEGVCILYDDDTGLFTSYETKTFYCTAPADYVDCCGEIEAEVEIYDEGDTLDTQTETCDVNPLMTAPTLLSPANAAPCQSTSVKLDWTSASCTEGITYEVYWGTTSSPPLYATVTTSEYYPPDIANEEYWWYVKACDCFDECSSKSSTWSYDTFEDPDKPCCPDPFNGASGVSIDADLQWGAADGATLYDVYFGTNASSCDSDYVTTVAVPYYNPGTLIGNTKYYWRINPRNDCDVSVGDCWSFTTLNTEQCGDGDCGSGETGANCCEDCAECCDDSDCSSCEYCDGSSCEPVDCGSCEECDGDHGCTPLECCDDSDCPSCELCDDGSCELVECGSCQTCDFSHGCEPIEDCCEQGDQDDDGVCDPDDKCPSDYDPGQEDCDGDGEGDACDSSPSTDEVCDDDVDNDCDGDADCDDSDCAEVEACTCEGEYCGNGSCGDECGEDCQSCPDDCEPTCGDNLCECDETESCLEDCEGCGDGQCSGDEDPCSCEVDCGSPPSTETACSDGKDNDCDGDTDNADSDCEPGPCPNECCSDADCGDGTSCTVDDCVSGSCIHTPTYSCGDGDCNSLCLENASTCCEDCAECCSDADCSGSAVCENHECLTDSDADGVPNARDECDSTPSGEEVDSDGCATCLNVTVIGPESSNRSDCIAEGDDHTETPPEPEPGFVFDHWEGDVPAGREIDDPLTLAVWDNMTLTPVYRDSCTPSLCGACGSQCMITMPAIPFGLLLLRFQSRAWRRNGSLTTRDLDRSCGR